MCTPSFALGVCLQHKETGEEVLRMCVAVKKKLQLYFWKDREFHELQVKPTATWAVGWGGAGGPAIVDSQLGRLRFRVVKVMIPGSEFSPEECSAVYTHSFFMPIGQSRGLQRQQ